MAHQRRGLAARRAGLGYTQESFADVVGVERSTVWRWESGVVVPLPEQCSRIRAVLGLMPSEFDELLREVTAERVSAPRQTSERRAASSWDDPDEVLLQLHELQDSNVGEGQVRLLEDQVQRIVADYEQCGPSELGPPTARLRRQVHQLLCGRQLLRTRYRLHRVAAQLAGLLGYMAVNTGRFRLASEYCAEALHLAIEIEDIGLQVWVWGTRSLGAYYQADFVRAHADAARGHALAPNSPQSIRLLANGEARALGQLGDRAGADAAIGHALALLDRYDVDPELTPCISFEPYGYARVAANAATAYVPLGDTPRVLHYTGDIDPAVEHADSDWSRALVRLDIATAVLRQQDADLEQALALGREALRVCADQPIRSVWQRANTLHGLTQRWANEPQVIEFTDQLRTWRDRPEVQAISGRTG
ncbi:helix-turn-helix domain-containing protein [Saccharopolyspora sp. ID03-671]|uniref:helix-turn-helix transcriptional regulator n=1 Tax=Saccharopolyspora sp. ID03-671 TaxID=3073066 RepID=UPI0032449402